MRFPISLYVSMTGYFSGKEYKETSVFRLVLMLEPTHRCNLTCAGCGRIREYQKHSRGDDPGCMPRWPLMRRAPPWSPSPAANRCSTHA